MKTTLAVIGAINIIFLTIILSPLLGVAYILLAPLILLCVILFGLVRKLTKRGERKEE